LDDYRIFYDDFRSIGRRYRRQDEAGTPFCVTVDRKRRGQGRVTIRDRDTLEQERVLRSRMRDRLQKLISADPPGAEGRACPWPPYQVA